MERAAPEEAVFTAKSNTDPSCPRCRHRIGRTARAGASGVALSLVGPKEMHRVEAIQEAQTRKVDEARGRAQPHARGHGTWRFQIHEFRMEVLERANSKNMRATYRVVRRSDAEVEAERAVE